MTILVIYDRLNGKQYKPREWNKRLSRKSNENESNEGEEEEKPKLETSETKIFEFFTGQKQKSKLILKPIREKTQFGSHLYVIRSFSLRKNELKETQRKLKANSFRLPINYRLRQPVLKDSNDYLLRNTFSLNDFYLKSKFFKQKRNTYSLFNNDDNKSIASFNNNINKNREKIFKSNMSFY